MKSKLLTLLLLCGISILTSCKKDQVQTAQVSLSGPWHLQNVSGGLMGLDLDYNRGEVVWKFNTTAKVVKVENNIITTGPKDIYAGLDSGSYPYEIKNLNGNQVLFVNTVEQGVLDISTLTLKIDEGVAADGFLKRFDR